ncbi:MAG: hypothetical protein EAX86_13255 [Candidatus Heimdallarchaeota archaeon]|nr:hypothetical protein [Candidatus Heimdallarchaeota archaeon]
MNTIPTFLISHLPSFIGSVVMIICLTSLSILFENVNVQNWILELLKSRINKITFFFTYIGLSASILGIILTKSDMNSPLYTLFLLFLIAFCWQGNHFYIEQWFQRRYTIKVEPYGVDSFL